MPSNVLRFESAVRTPHPENDVVHARYVPAENGSRRAGVVLLPQWNSDGDGHIGLAKLLARFGMSGLRLSLPYHDVRMPPELTRADYIVSANVGRTLAVCRQAVLDARRAVMWMAARGYERIGILGTSLGSCLSMLTAAHEPLVRAAALNHVSPYFADVVWDGLSTEHVREGLEGRVELDALRRMWLPISPQPYLDRMRDTRTLLVYARYDLTFPVEAVTPADRRLRLARPAPPVVRAAVRPLQHRRLALQMGGWLRADEVPARLAGEVAHASATPAAISTRTTTATATGSTGPDAEAGQHVVQRRPMPGSASRTRLWPSPRGHRDRGRCQPIALMISCGTHSASTALANTRSARPDASGNARSGTSGTRNRAAGAKPPHHISFAALGR